MTNDVVVRSAGAEDAALVMKFIQELAEYERLSNEVVATEEMIAQTLFGAHPAAEVVIAEWQGRPAGFALFFSTYSTFLGKSGIWLEDLFVKPALRGKGIGRLLLAHLARLAVERNCGRLEWAVLNWNEPAIGFYRRLGALAQDEWTTWRLTGQGLDNLAGLED